jgi:hypothetical protein
VEPSIFRLGFDGASPLLVSVDQPAQSMQMLSNAPVVGGLSSIWTKMQDA